MAGNREDESITLLGNNNVSYPTDYAPEMLETFENKHPENDYFVKFNCPEFTSLCPITGQPDFATIYISYVPNVRMVESKSLKLYLFSFRNHGDFHEDCVNKIMKDLIAVMDPKYIEVWGKFTPRGGISIDPYILLHLFKCYFYTKLIINKACLYIAIHSLNESLCNCKSKS